MSTFAVAAPAPVEAAADAPRRPVISPAVSWAAPFLAIALGLWAEAAPAAGGGAGTSATGWAAIGVGIVSLLSQWIIRSADKDAAVREAEQRFAMERLQDAFNNLELQLAREVATLTTARDAEKQRADRNEADARRLAGQLELAQARVAVLEAEDESSTTRRRRKGTSGEARP